MQDAGVYRLTPRSHVIEAYFDWDTCTIGPYSLKPEYGYVPYYHTHKAMPDKKWLYYCLSIDSYAVVAVFINNTYVACMDIYGVIYYYDIYNNVKIYTEETGEIIDKNDYIPIGYELTVYKCQSVFLTPAQLIYSANRKAVNVKGNWIPILDNVGILRKDDFSLYVRLIKSEKDYVYLRQGDFPVWCKL